MPIDGLLFDKDGTLFDFQATWSLWARALLADLARGDAAAEAAMAEAIGYDRAEARFLPWSPVIAGTGDEAAALLAGAAPQLSRERIVLAVRDGAAAVQPVPAAPLDTTLGGLRARGLRLGVATNDYETVAHRHLGAHAVHFDFIAGFDSGHGAKPAPGMLLAFAHRTGLAPSRCAMVGDSRHDLAAGRAAGMVTIAVLTGVAQADELHDLADVVLPNIGHIADWLNATLKFADP